MIRCTILNQNHITPKKGLINILYLKHGCCAVSSDCVARIVCDVNSVIEVPVNSGCGWAGVGSTDEYLAPRDGVDHWIRDVNVSGSWRETGRKEYDWELMK